MKHICPNKIVLHCFTHSKKQLKLWLKVTISAYRDFKSQFQLFFGICVKLFVHNNIFAFAITPFVSFSFPFILTKKGDYSLSLSLFFCVDECELNGKERDTKGVKANGKMLLCTNSFTKILKNNWNRDLKSWFLKGKKVTLKIL